MSSISDQRINNLNLDKLLLRRHDSRDILADKRDALLKQAERIESDLRCSFYVNKQMRLREREAVKRRLDTYIAALDLVINLIDEA